MSRNMQDIVRQAHEMDMQGIRKQEYYENLKEIQQCLFRYTGPTIIRPDCVLMSEDYVSAGSNGTVQSSRGTVLDLDAEKLMAGMSKGFKQVFNPGDLNSPDIFTRLAKVLRQVKQQSICADAQIHLIDTVRPHHGYAFYTDANGNVLVHAEKNGEDIAYHENDVEEVTGNVRECTYDEFNPGSRLLHTKLEQSVNLERTNKKSAYMALQEQLQQTGSVNEKDPVQTGVDAYARDKILSDSSKSSYEKLMAYNQMDEQIQENEAYLQQQGINDSMDEMDGPLASRMSRYM